MNLIKKLPSIIIDQIAAGEVVEGPFSVVKELLENSIDAKASSITVMIKAGGTEKIHIIDNGYGMTPVDLKNAFKYFFNWLKEDGVMSHQVDFKSHGFAKEWNGHWAYNNFEWMLVRGRRKWLINRKPLSYHLRLYKNNQFEIIHKKNIYAQNGISRNKLSSNFLNVSDEDMNTSGSYILSKKK